MSLEIKGWLYVIGESIAIFTVSVCVLYVVRMVIDRNRATGIGVMNAEGVVFIAVGILYIVCGFVMTRLQRMPGIPPHP